MELSFRKLTHAFCVGLLALAMAGAPSAKVFAKVPSDQEVAWYQELYKASVIRAIKFADEPDPNEAVREEIFLERELAAQAEKHGTTSDPLLQADIRYYQQQEILNALLEKRVPVDAVTTAEIERYYQEHADLYRTTETVKFRHIFFLVPKGDAAAENQKLELAKKVKAKLDQGADFGELAAEYSDLPAAKRNKGVVGPERFSKLNPALQAALAKLQPGAISDPVRTPYGWEILQLLERRPPRTLPLNEVADSIRNELRREKAAQLQEQLSEEVAKQFPAIVNRELFQTSGPLARDAWVFAVDGTTFTVERVLADIYATWSYHKIADERERIRAALPRLVLTQQVLRLAQASGLLDEPAVKAKLQFIHNRLAAERYWQKLGSDYKPTAEDVRRHYEENRDVFRTAPQAKGIVFRWKLDAAETSGSVANFARESLRQKVKNIREQALRGELKLDDVRKLADEAKDLDWFPEGPNGYLFDKAFFSAPAKSFTEVFDQRDAVAFGWVEARKEGEQIPFEQCRERVERRLINLKGQELRKKAVEEILQQYARQGQ